jgi:hypothetical protein
MTTNSNKKVKDIREPSLLDALIPLLFMIALLATSIVLFGLDAAVGPLQVALLMSAIEVISPHKFVPVIAASIRLPKRQA